MIAHITSLTDTHAATDKFILDALFSSGTRGTRAADVWSFRLLAATAVRITRGTAGTLAGEGARFVVANRALGTGIYGALVDVSAATLHSRFACVAIATETSRNVVREHAVSVGSAGEVLTGI